MHVCVCVIICVCHAYLCVCHQERMTTSSLLRRTMMSSCALGVIHKYVCVTVYQMINWETQMIHL